MRLKRLLTVLVIALMSLSGIEVAAEVGYNFWITSEGSGMQITSNPYHIPYHRPRHHHHYRPSHHHSKKAKKRFKKMVKARKKYEKARHEYYKSSRHHRHHH